jgi:hypothetical protein
MTSLTQRRGEHQARRAATNNNDFGLFGRHRFSFRIGWVDSRGYAAGEPANIRQVSFAELALVSAMWTVQESVVYLAAADPDPEWVG